MGIIGSWGFGSWVLTIFAIGLFSYVFLNPPKQKPDVVSEIDRII